MKRNGWIAEKTLRFSISAALAVSLVIGCGGGSETGNNTNNTAPIANAGQDENVTTGSVVTLNGGACTDADGDLLTYSWSFMSRPAGSSSVLSSASSVRPTFTADKDGDYVISLVVNDGHKDSDPDTVTITALNPVGGWGIPTLIETGSGNAEYPSVAMDDNGNAITVWKQYDGGTDAIYASRYILGTGWGTPTLIKAGSGSMSIEGVSVAVDESGNALAVWWQSGIYAKYFTQDTGWGTAEFVEPYGGESGVGRVSQPGVVMGVSGKAMVVWQESKLPLDGTANSIWSKIFDPETGWGDAMKIVGESTRPTLPSVAMDGNGNSVALWLEGCSPFREQCNVYANRYVPGKGWETPTLIETDAGGPPHVTMDRGGNATAVWSQMYEGWERIYASNYLPGTGWGTPTPVDSGSGDAYFPSLAMDANGNAVVVWVQAVGGPVYSPRDYSIWSNRYTPGTGWSEATLIYNPPVDADSPAVAVDEQGNAICVWTQGKWAWVDGFWDSVWAFLPSDIYASTFIRGKGWSTATLIDSQSVNTFRPTQMWPAIAVSADGNGILVWQKWDGSTHNIWANEYVRP